MLSVLRDNYFMDQMLQDFLPEIFRIHEQFVAMEKVCMR